MALQEVFALEGHFTEAMSALGFALVTERLPPKEDDEGPERKRGGVALFANTKTVLAAPVALPDLGRFTAAAAHFTSASPDGSITTVASIYWSPSPLTPGSPPELEFREALDTLDALGVNVVVGDPNARHRLWCPGTRVIPQPALGRGISLAAFLRFSRWSLASNPSFASRPKSNTSPDVVLAHAHLRPSARYHPYYRRNPGHCQSVSDHAPLQVEVWPPSFLPSKAHHRCPQIAWEKVEWGDISTQLASFFKAATRLPASAHAADHHSHFRRGVDRSISKLPHRRRHPTRPPRFPPEIRAKMASVSESIHAKTVATDAIRDLREQVASFLEEEEGRKFWALGTMTRGPDWGKRLWREVFPPLVSAACLTDTEGKPLQPLQAANAFASCFAEKHRRSIPPQPPPPYAPPAEPTIIFPGEVREALQALRLSQAPDPRGIKPCLLRSYPPDTVAALARCFTSNIRDGFVPPEWKCSQVLPILKEGKPPDLKESYRPVALTDLHCRLMESILLSRLRLHLRHHGELSSRQFGFRRGLGTQMAWVHTVSSLKEGAAMYTQWPNIKPPSSKTGPRLNRAAEKNGGTPQWTSAVAAVDFSDAFCRLCPSAVARALRRRGVPEDLIRWISCFLTGRSIRVVVDGRHSRVVYCEVGAPQGSILGPFLWSIVMDDLLVALEAHCTLTRGLACRTDGSGQLHVDATTPVRVALAKARGAHRTLFPPDKPNSTSSRLRIIPPPLNDFGAFADDTHLWSSAFTPRESAAQLQVMLDIVAQWAEENGVPLSPKTQIRWVGVATNVTSLQPTVPIPIRFGDLAIEIPPVRKANTAAPPAVPPPLKILGLWVDSRLNFGEHVHRSLGKVRSRLEQAKLKISLLPPGPRKILVEGICLPLITAALPIIWGSLTDALKLELERELNDMARVVTGAIATARGADCRLEAGLHDPQYYKERESLSLSRRVWMLPSSFAYLEVPKHFSSGDPDATFDHDSPLLPQSPRHILRRKPVCQGAQWPPLAALSPALIGLAVTRTSFLTKLPVGFKKEKAGNSACHAFNLLQLRGSFDLELWTDGSVQEEHGLSRTGGAWMIFLPEELIAQGSLSLGSLGCSYSLEREALRAGLRALAVMVGDGSLSRHPRSIRVVSDSLSTLQELQGGPHRQSEEGLESMWADLATLLPAKVTFTFTFSHVHPEGSSPRHEAIDDSASLALSASATCPQWPRDLLRPLLTSAKKASESRMKDGSKRERFGIEPSFEDLYSIGLSAVEHHRLMQLRTGASVALGGWRHGAPDPCPHCAAPLGRISEPGAEWAVAHMFSCPSLPHTDLTPASLWEAHKPTLERLKLFQS